MIITFTNQKGGIGKTTTCLSVGAAIAGTGKTVLLTDIDPQGNLSTSAGAKPKTSDTTVYEVLKGADVNAAVVPVGSYDVLPADIRLSGAEIELSAVPGRDYLLKEALASLKKQYDYILIDCPPSLSILTLMGLSAADSVIVPVQAQYLALDGLSQLKNTIDIVKKRINPELDIAGIVLTMYDDRLNLNKAVLEKTAKVFPGKVYDTRISTNVSLAEAPVYGKDIFAYKPKSKGALQYRALTKEILKESAKHGKKH